jgi:hypothetical protein
MLPERAARRAITKLLTLAQSLRINDAPPLLYVKEIVSLFQNQNKRWGC